MTWATNKTNGNGHAGNGHGGNDHALSRRNHQIEPVPDAAIMELPPWLKAMRDAMGESISGEDLKEVMAAQVKAAKGGNIAAANFVMNQAHRLIESERKRVNIIQNNFFDTPPEKRPDTPIEPDDGNAIDKLAARAAAHQPLTGRPDDRRCRPISDEEEKALRRREAENEE